MNIVVLAGGTGGAKLAHGIQLARPAGELTVVVNTGDDLERHGLLVMPDHDAVMYMLAGLFDDERGWGITNESWATIGMLERYGEDAWFRLGDQDLGTHIARNVRLRDGLSLTEAVLDLQAALGIPSTILPMADEPVRTAVRTDDGWLEFQEYFVHRGQAPDVREVRYDGIDAARPTTQVRAAIGAADVIVIGPSNPIVSLGPILAVPAMAELLGRARTRGTPIVAVSGIVGGVALKGPADRMLASMGHESSARGVAALLAPHIDAFVLDAADADQEAEIAALGLKTLVTDTIMADHEGRARLAREVIDFAVPPPAEVAGDPAQSPSEASAEPPAEIPAEPPAEP
jgi:LPPG:FO 2-phospho-L-lactate transferase